MSLYAVKITKANVGAITSEGGPEFHQQLILDWIDENGEHGYFIRDAGSPFDCTPMMPTVFDQIYMFESLDDGSLFRRIIRQ